MTCVQVSSYAYACERTFWGLNYQATCMLPLLDLLNHR